MMILSKLKNYIEAQIIFPFVFTANNVVEKSEAKYIKWNSNRQLDYYNKRQEDHFFSY